MSKPIVKIDIDDVRHAGSVEAAIIAACKESDSVASGVVGMEFATSGPGTGWSKQYGPDEWSREAFSRGAVAYVDETDGRVLRTEPWEGQDNNGKAVYTDIGGGEYVLGDWSSESEVCVTCPDEDDALSYPEIFAEMARSVIDHHGPMSDRRAWRELISRIKEAADALDGIDADDIDD